jgi:hypothetical protein
VSAFVVFDVEIRDMTLYQDFMTTVKPALAAAGARAFSPPGGAITGPSFTSDTIQRFLRRRIGPVRKETISRLRWRRHTVKL